MATRRCSYCGSSRGATSPRGDWVCYVCGQTTPASSVSAHTVGGKTASCGDLTVTCPQCRSAYRADQAAIGKMVRCKHCGTSFPVPGPAISDSGLPATLVVHPANLAMGGSAGIPPQFGIASASPSLQPAGQQGAPTVLVPPNAPAADASPRPTPSIPASSNVPPPPVDKGSYSNAIMLSLTVGAGVLAMVLVIVVLVVIWRGPDRANQQARQPERKAENPALRLPDDRNAREPKAPSNTQPAPNASSAAKPPVQPPAQPAGEKPVAKPEIADPPPAKAPAELKELFAQLAPSVPLVVAKLDEQRGGYGSGFLVQHNGHWYVATNNHVVENAASELGLIFLDDKGRLLHRAVSPRIRIARMSKEADVALIDCEGIAADLRERKISPVRLAPHNYQPPVGEKVFAIGHPGAGERDILPQTLTEGIVSGVGRQFNDPMIGGMRFLQTTASVNPGNSGGPLFDFTGQVVGINTLVIRRSPNPGVNLEGLNFALEIRHLHDLLENPDLSFTQQEIRDMLGRRVRRPGAKPVELKPEVRKVLEQEVIIGVFQQQRFTFQVRARESLILAAQPVGVDLVELTLRNARGQIVARGIQTFDNPPLLCEAPGEGMYTLWVANPNFIPAVVRVVVGAARAP